MRGTRLIVFRLAIAGVALLAGAVAARGQTPPGTFRAGVDVVAIDVHVVDSESRPVPGLTPDQFTVTIDGKKRRVLSADYFDSAADPDAPGGRGAVPGGPSGQSRQVIMLAIDASSFRPTLSRAITDAAKRFVVRLRPDEEIGLYVFPNGPKLGVTTDHASIARALDGVIGQADTGGGDRFHLAPGDLIDLSLWAEGAGRAGTPALVDRLCGDDSNCIDALRNQVHANAAYYEGRAHASLGMFRSMLSAFAGMPGRTVVVLLSAGMVASDTVGGRPDLGDFGIQIGKDASAANVNVYTVFVDQRWLEAGSAESRNARNPESRLARDSEVLGRWLDQFAGAAGGALFKVVAGDGGPIFDRILRETSSYYLLGVEPAREDRDGRAHGIRVKVSARNAIVRSRQWVTVPVASARLVAPASDAVREPLRLPVTPPAVPTPSTALAPLIAAFERGDDAGVVEGVLRSQDPLRLIRDLRNVSGLLWRGAPRREALLALDIGLAAMRRRNPDEERGAAALIAQANVLARQTEPADAFECTWYRLEAAGLLTLLRPAIALPLIGQGLQRCPREGQLALARAIAIEQQWSLQPLPAVSAGATPTPNPEQARDVPAAYEPAIANPNTMAEARTRLAWFYFRYGQIARARETIDAIDRIGAPPTDPRVQYFTGLIRGQILLAQGDAAQAVVAYRAALAAVPAQSARIALMTALAASGRRDESESLAIEVQSAPSPFDPWWAYWFGESLIYPQILAVIRANLH